VGAGRRLHVFRILVDTAIPGAGILRPAIAFVIRMTAASSGQQERQAYIARMGRRDVCRRQVGRSDPFLLRRQPVTRIANVFVCQDVGDRDDQRWPRREGHIETAGRVEARRERVGVTQDYRLLYS
jgi:hypothetical protein